MVIAQAPRELLHVAHCILSFPQIVGTHNGNIVSLLLLYQCHQIADITSTPSPSHLSRYCAHTTPTRLPQSPPFPFRPCRARSLSSTKLARRLERQMIRLRENLRHMLAATLVGHSRTRSQTLPRTRSTLDLRPLTATFVYPR